MKNVNEAMQNFREASRHIWNTYLVPGTNVVQFEIEEAFDNIERELLRCLVFDGRSDDVREYRKQGLENLVVRPAEGLTEVPIQSGTKQGNGNIVWQEAEMVAIDRFPDLRFFDFFDWSHYGSIDYGLVRAVEHGNARPALLPHMYCTYWVRD